MTEGVKCMSGMLFQSHAMQMLCSVCKVNSQVESYTCSVILLSCHVILPVFRLLERSDCLAIKSVGVKLECHKRQLHMRKQESTTMYHKCVTQNRVPSLPFYTLYLQYLGDILKCKLNVDSRNTKFLCFV